jgi:hypothetical protein
MTAFFGIEPETKRCRLCGADVELPDARFLLGANGGWHCPGCARQVTGRQGMA